MPRFHLDLIHDRRTGNVELAVEIEDSSRSPMDIHDAIEDGSLQAEVIEHIRSTWGAGLADQISSGAIGMKCTDVSRTDRQELQEILERHKITETGPEDATPESVTESSRTRLRQDQ